MEAVVFCGIQGSGKSSFYLHRFYRSHVRLNLDMLGTRRRERILLEACLEAGQRFVVDNTNVTRAGRAIYIAAAKASNFRVIGYFLDCPIHEALKRNAARPGNERIPEGAVRAMAARLELPSVDEGFDELHRVRASGEGRFEVEPML